MNRKLVIFSILIYGQLAMIAMADIIAPPNIDKNQKQEFSQWKEHYLNSRSPNSSTNHYDATYVNELVFSQSPYLLQHSNNPINWKPWSNSLLQQAKRKNKLILLSIGYSSCHWCHVMNKESFSSVKLAKIINANYYAIKVDREELPHIDDYYMNALQALKQSGGWPITAIINGDGLPVFIDSYITKEKLLELVPKLNSLWKTQPNFLLSMAKELSSMIASKPPTLLSSDENRYSLESNHALLENTNSKLVSLLDENFGGYKGTAKFPSETMLLYSLGQLLIKPNARLERLIQLQLNNMINGELYDHIGSGFFRYATKSDWTTPHYEKTLYNQAQLILVYAKAYQYFSDKKYLSAVQQISQFLIDDFYIKRKGFMSAMDADFHGLEGGYYLWSKSALEAFNIPNQMVDIYQVHGSEKLGVIFKQPESTKEKTLLHLTREKLLAERKKRGDPNIDNKVITSWNGLAIKALVAASSILDDSLYLKHAQQVAKYLWNNRFDNTTGTLNRTSYTIANNLTYLEDYAYLADAFITLYDATSNTEWLAKAEILDKNATVLFEKSDGNIFNNSATNRLYLSNDSSDSELLSSQSVFLSVKNKLNRRKNTRTLLKNDKSYRTNLHQKISLHPITHLSDSTVLSNLINGSTENYRYFANSNGKVIFNCVQFNENACHLMEIDIFLKNDWHINSDIPLQSHLIATQISPNKDINVTYPIGTQLKLGFQVEPVSVFSAQVKITVEKTLSNLGRIYLNLPLQACNNNVCLLPEQLNFVM